MLHSSSQLPAPGRLFLPGCAIAAGLLAVSSPVFAAPVGKARPKTALAKVALAKPMPPMTLRVGKTAIFPMPRLTTFTLESGAQNVFCEVKNGTLTVKALDEGEVKMRLNTPGQPAQVINLKLVEPRQSIIETRSISQVVERAATDGAVPSDIAPNTTLNVGSNTSETAPDSNAGLTTTEGTATSAPATSGAAPAPGAAPNTVPNTIPDPVTGVMPGTSAGGTAPSALSTDLSGDVNPPAPPAPTLPALTPPVLTERATPSSPVAPPVNTRPASTTARAPQISPVLPAPARGKKANVSYTTTARLPQGISSAGRQGISVTQGLARLLSFPSNILAVFFSDPNVMDARAINARTIAVTGIGPGPSTLAVFTSRYPGDAVGKANIYRINTAARGGQSTIETRDPRVVETAITTALGDPRVRVAVITLPDGSLLARLSGNVRNEVESQAAVTTASFYVPRVISSLYADANAPTLEAVVNGTYNLPPEAGLQENLRRITGNQTIELIQLPTGLGFKAEVDSPDEAEALLRVLPTLNQQVIPFIVVHGQQDGGYYNATVPLLNGEDRQLTQKLMDVTGIRTVYAVRTASNTLACYGTVRTRTEYDTVRRFMTGMAQSSTPAAVAGTSQGGSSLRPQGADGSPLPNYDPTGGYARNLGLQMFVRITDPTQSVIRKVTVETNVVEISRTALRNLGVQFGSATLQNETVTAGTSQIARDAAGNPLIGSNGQPFVVQTTPGIITRTIDPTFNQGTLLGGNGFIGSGGFSNINPFRAQLTALSTSGDVHLLANPNITSLEGAAAQITIGGEIPVPKSVATNGAVGTQVEFRRYGVIVSMRPTVTGDNTIILQIRADITQPDRTFQINLGGALIPGATVRSIDTTLNVRPGDTVVMGGLLNNEKRQALSKVPVLGDLPIIGKLFQSKRYDNNETELAIFMTPRIDAMPADMQTLETMFATPSFPTLPSRQESNAILFQDNTRSGG